MGGSWSDPNTDIGASIRELLDASRAAYQREQENPVGTERNPHELWVPRWLIDRYGGIEKAQADADRLFLPYVTKVVEVPPL